MIKNNKYNNFFFLLAYKLNNINSSYYHYRWAYSINRFWFINY